MMSYNLGNRCITALSQLRSNPDFQDFLAAFYDDVVAKKTHEALRAPEATRVHATSYVAALEDTWIAMQAGVTGANPRQVRPPNQASRRIVREDEHA